MCISSLSARWLYSLLAAGLALLFAGCGRDEVVEYHSPKSVFPETSSIRKQLEEARAGMGGAHPHPHPPGGDQHSHPHPPASDPHQNVASRPAEAPSFRFEKPEAWEEQPLGPMRKASFLVRGEAGAMVDISAMNFPGDTGGLHANVNRWRGQVGLGPLNPTELEAGLERRVLNGRDFLFVDMEGPPGDSGTAQRILGAIHARPDETWFFKLMGEARLTAAQRDALIGFLDTADF